MLLAFNHLFAGLEAYVSAHLADFPGDLRVEAVPGGVGAAVSLPDPPAMNRAPIGIFDSGIGGLTVARAIYERLPHESTIYFGDTARVPYGPKSPDTVRRYSLEILHWLLGQGVKAVVIACNTSTAHALRRAAGGSLGAGYRGNRAWGAGRCVGNACGGRSGSLARPAPSRATPMRGPSRRPCRGPRSSSGPVRCSCPWSRKAGSSIRPRS